MRFDVMSWTRSGATRHEALRGRGEQRECVPDLEREVVGDEQHAREQPGQEAGGVGAIALARTRRQVGLVAGGQAQHRGDVVGQDLGGDIDEQGLLGQARDAFQVKAMLEPLEGFLDAPALVIEVAEDIGREVALVEVGGQHTHEAAGGSLADQAHAWRRARASEVGRVARAGAAEIDPLLLRPRGQEPALGGPAAGVVAAHTEANASGVQDGDQPRSRVAAVEHEHVVGTQAIQGLEQHLPLADLGAMHAGMHGQFRAGKVQGEQALISARRGAVQPMAGPHRRRQERGVGGDHAQPLPRGNHPRGPHALHESVVDGAQHIGAQAITRSGERTIRRYALRQRTVSEVGEEVVQPRLLRLVALAQHGGDQGRQRQLASPGEGVGRVLATRPTTPQGLSSLD